MTLSYAATERFVLGLDYRPQSDDLTPLASYRLLDETQTRPALIAGASADEFDNEISMTYHLVLSKKLAEFGGVSFSPYIGPMYIQTRDELTMIGGFSARKDIASLMGMWSGEYFHLVGKLDLNDHLSVGVVWWGMKTLGVTTGIRF